MSRVVIPLVATESQVLTVTLGSQACRLKVYQKRTGLFIDVYVNDALIIGGVLCHNLNAIVRDPYLGFVGDLAFFDTAGTDDPLWTGLGSRWLLLWDDGS